MVTIVGAGMAGLLAGNLLRNLNPVIVEKQSSLPHNHSAVLRFRTDIIGQRLGIPFNEVQMIKEVVPWRNTIADALAYSRKNLGVSRSDRSVIAGRVIDKRFIAPPNLIELMAAPLNIEYNAGLDDGTKDECPVISTIPMPALMRLLDYPRADEVLFHYVTGLNVSCTLRDTNAYVSLLVPDPGIPFSRVSITGDQLVAEIPRFNFSGTDQLIDKITEQNVENAVQLLGFKRSHISPNTIQHAKQSYAKIAPIDDEVRKDFMFWATDNFNVYSLGRFATWRPGLMLDDLVKDIELIQRWVTSKSRYAVARHR